MTICIENVNIEIKFISFVCGKLEIILILAVLYRQDSAESVPVCAVCERSVYCLGVRAESVVCFE